MNLAFRPTHTGVSVRLCDYSHQSWAAPASPAPAPHLGATVVRARDPRHQVCVGIAKPDVYCRKLRLHLRLDLRLHLSRHLLLMRHCLRERRVASNRRGAAERVTRTHPRSGTLCTSRVCCRHPRLKPLYLDLPRGLRYAIFNNIPSETRSRRTLKC
jgi:hypothetical protein